MQILPVILNTTFINEVKLRLIEENPAKIRACLNQLTDEEIWERIDPHLPSVGNLILHLCGNVRQYIISGAGGYPDVRQRSQEFAEAGPMPKAVLTNKMDELLEEVVKVLDKISPETLIEVKPVQCYEMSVMSMILHATEHFSYHTGQIIFYTKMKRKADMGFYDDQHLEAKG